MRRALAEHWKGVAMGLMLYAIWAVYFVGSHWVVRTQCEREVAAHSPAPVFRMEDGTEVVEDLCGVTPDPRWFDRLLTLLTPFGAGALAAWVGRGVVAWRGALAGAVASVAFIPFLGIPLGGSVEQLQVLAFGGVLAVMGYAGGGLMKLLTRARSSTA